MEMKSMTVETGQKVVVYPGKGIEIKDRGLLPFDTHRDEVLEYFGCHEPPLQGSNVEIDRFREYIESCGIFTTFRSNRDLRLIGIGFSDDYEVYLEGQKLFHVPIADLLSWLRREDPALLEHEYEEALFSDRLALILVWNQDTYPHPYIAKNVYFYLPPFHLPLRENFRT